MRKLRSIVVLLGCAGVWGAAQGCGGQSKGEGSESHFVHCHSDTACADAGADFVCLDGYCVAPNGDAGNAVPMTKADAPPSMLDACSVATNAPGPYPVTFTFENTSDTPLGFSLPGGCGGHYTVTSCADGYQRPLALSAPCGAICPAMPQCTDGQCYDMPQTVESSAGQKEDWDGYEYVQRTPPVQCSDQLVAKAGKYRITVPVFAPGSSVSGAPLYSVSVDFTLPAPLGTVHVRLDQGSKAPPMDSGACIPALGRRYETSGDCYDAQVSTGACLYESSPGTTSGISEIACLIAPDGTRYAIVKGYTQCLDAASVRAGYAVKGATGLCEGDPIDPMVDQACMDAISRGYWPGGPFGPPNLDFPTSDDGGARGNLVVECADGGATG